MKIENYIDEWLKQHPATCVNRRLRQLLAHYIDFYPEKAVPDLSELVLNIMAVMELVDALENVEHYVKEDD